MVVDGWNGVGPALGLRGDACSRVRACDGEVSNGGGLFNIPSTNRFDGFFEIAVDEKCTFFRFWRTKRFAHHQ